MNEKQAIRNKKIINLLKEEGFHVLDEKEILGTDKKVNLIDNDGYKYYTSLNYINQNVAAGGSRKSAPFHQLNPHTYDNICLWINKNIKDYTIDYFEYVSSKTENILLTCNICNNTWNSSWNKIQLGKKCPCCFVKIATHYSWKTVVAQENSLGSKYPELLKDWDYEKNIKSPFDYAPHSRKKVFWKCSTCGESWFCVIQSRTSKNCGCPYCAHHTKTVRSIDSLGNLYPDLISEWDYDKNSNSPFSYSPNSHQKVFWMCSLCGFEWNAEIKSRAKHGSGCPGCSYSKAEEEISRFLKSNNINFIPQFKFDDCRNVYLLSYDFGIFKNNSLAFLIEAQGKQHYTPIEYFGGEKTFLAIQKRDRIKFEYCQNNNIPLLLIPYWESKNIDVILTKYLNI